MEDAVDDTVSAELDLHPLTQTERDQVERLVDRAWLACATCHRGTGGEEREKGLMVVRG